MSSMAFFNNRQVTPKWLVWSGQNSNSSEILFLSWLPESLTKIRSIMNVLARRHHFPIIVYENFFQCSRARSTEVNDPVRLEFELACLGYLQVWRRSDQNWLRKGENTIFPTIIQWEFLIAMTATVLINLLQPFAHPTEFDQDWQNYLRGIHVWKRT